MKTTVNTIELYFEWWLSELKQVGIVKDFERESEVFQVASEAKYGRIKRFKRKPNEVEQFNLFQKIEYTYDYKIIWDINSAEYTFIEIANESNIFQFGKPLLIAHRVGDEVVSYVDVKPTTSVSRRGGKVSSAVSFPYKQRMLWESKRIYINKVVPIPMAGTGFNSALFIKSFVPKRYLLTDGGKQARKIKWTTVSLKQYVNTKVRSIETILKSTKDGE